ncbi:MAG: aspartate/glutamate racemase family protein [Pseudomonadales bacterium]|nr:aspartate/glutamate racemase family protein [Pseudomonadales bacterium]
MRTLGLLGGMSWESTVPYYQVINRRVAERLGGLHSASLLLWSPDFAEIERLQAADAWDEAGDVLGAGARRLVDAGAELLVLCTNTMHRVADAVEAAAGRPLLHIADATGERLRALGVRRVGLLGTRFTMEQAFYRDRLAERFELEVRVPDAEARGEVHRIIYEELCRGVVDDASRDRLRRMVDDLAGEGAEAVILGCTELGLSLREHDGEVPLLDTARIHGEAAADAALADEALTEDPGA